MYVIKQELFFGLFASRYKVKFEIQTIMAGDITMFKWSPLSGDKFLPAKVCSAY